MAKPKSLKPLPLGVGELDAISKQNSIYGFRGGNIGGDVWGSRQPTEMERSMGKNAPIPVLKEQYKEKVNEFGQRSGVRVLPAGAGSRQELRWLKESAERDGVKWVEAPTEYKRGSGTSDRDRKEQFYSPTGQPMGTIMGRGSYGGFGGGGAGGRPNTTQRSWTNYVGDKPIERYKGTGFYGDSSVWSEGGSGLPISRGNQNTYGSKNMAENLSSWENSPRWTGGQGPSDLASAEERGSWEARAPLRKLAFEQSTPMGQRLTAPTTSPMRSGLGGSGFGGVPKFPTAGKY